MAAECAGRFPRHLSFVIRDWSFVILSSFVIGYFVIRSRLGMPRSPFLEIFPSFDAAGPWPLLLFAGTCVGHTAVILFCLNRIYGCALPRGFLRLLRRVCEAVILTSPFLFWYLC